MTEMQVGNFCAMASPGTGAVGRTADIPKTQFAISGGGDQPAAVGMPGDFGHQVGVFEQ